LQRTYLEKPLPHRLTLEIRYHFSGDVLLEVIIADPGQMINGFVLLAWWGRKRAERAWSVRWSSADWWHHWTTRCTTTKHWRWPRHPKHTPIGKPASWQHKISWYL